MNRNGLYLCALLVMVTSSVSAGLKLDALSMVERAPLDFAGDMGETATVVTDSAAMGKEVYQKGMRAKTLYEKVKLKSENAIEKFNSLEPSYDDAEENNPSYEDELAKAEETLANLPTSLKVEGKYLELSMEDRKKALITEATGKKQAAEQNIELLNVLLNDAEDNETKSTIQNKINEYKSVVDTMENTIDDLNSVESKTLQSDNAYQNLAEDSKKVKSKLTNVASKATSVFAGLTLVGLSGMLKKSSAQKANEYNKVLTDNFIMPGTDENNETVTKVKKHRTEMLIEAITDAIVIAAKYKNRSDKEEEETLSIQDNVMGAEQQVSVIGMGIEQKIQETQLLHEYNKLILANMKLKTALNMNNQDYRLKYYDSKKDPTVLNLDNYVFSEKDIVKDEGKKGFLDKIKAR